jgi:hypothetical protein
VGGIATYTASFSGRGVQSPLFPVLLYDNPTFKTATNIASTPYDDGTVFSAGTTLGGVACLQVYNITAVAATGTVTVAGIAVANDTLTITIGSTVYSYTFVASLTAPNQILIAGTAALQALYVFYALSGARPDLIGTYYSTGTTSIPQNLLTTPLIVSAPNSGTNTITLTAANAYLGTAGNAIATAKSGTGGVGVGGATLAGGEIAAIDER